ncbi:MAG: queuosine salvage family protein [Actinomycetota bacterium]
MESKPAIAAHWSTPVLESVLPVVEMSQHVRTSPEAVRSVAGWMAHEEFTFPHGSVTGNGTRSLDPHQIMDSTFFETLLNFAFTDFDTGIKYTVTEDGCTYSDTEGMTVRIQEAIDTGIPILEGGYLAGVTRGDLEKIFAGDTEMPMLDERVEILNEAGTILVDRYNGRFHNFVADCTPAQYADGDGILERLVDEFPRFNDESDYHGSPVKIYKLAQLGLWVLHRALRGSGTWQLTDIDTMTAFADYIVPVGLNLMGVLEYTDDLSDRIANGIMLERDSDEEIEIRAHTLYATALLTDAINEIRPADAQLLIPEIDYRFWKTYHATFKPHHLTRTTMY